MTEQAQKTETQGNKVFRRDNRAETHVGQVGLVRMQRSWKNPVSLVHGKEPSKLFDVALDRTDFHLPALMPSAPGAVVASEQLVHHATSGCPQISPYRRLDVHDT